MDLSRMLTASAPLPTPVTAPSSSANMQPTVQMTAATSALTEPPPPNAVPILGTTRSVPASSSIATPPGKRRRSSQSPPPPETVSHDAEGSGTYSRLAARVQHALSAGGDNSTGLDNGAGLSTADKVALALEVLRARQLELDLAQARANIEAIASRSRAAPRTLRSVIPAQSAAGLPIGAPIDIVNGKLVLSHTTNDPTALFLTLEIQAVREGAAPPGDVAAEKSMDGEDMPINKSGPGASVQVQGAGASGVQTAAPVGEEKDDVEGATEKESTAASSKQKPESSGDANGNEGKT